MTARSDIATRLALMPPPGQPFLRKRLHWRPFVASLLLALQRRFDLPQILVRKLPDSVVERLKARARRNTRSLEAEVRAILEEVVTREKAEFLKAADEMRARLSGGHHTETLELLREDRDR